jgi:putative ABC transport system ATP-binding protein
MTRMADGAPRTTDWVIETEGLARTYRVGTTQVRALRGVDIRIAPGQFVALMGPSGCGKSTLMQLLGCLDTPTEGCYWLEGRDVGALSGDERARLRRTRIGFVFQTFNLLPRLTALENVALPLLYQKHAAGVRERAASTLAHLGLSHRADHRPAEMSGGECQRVAIARAVITRPGIILADEPTGNLDSSTGAEIMDLLGRLNAEGRTLLVVTHDAEVAAHAGRILHMHDGQIVGCVASEDETVRPGLPLLSVARREVAHVSA